MRLARLVYRNNNPWRYGDGTKINLSIGTIVQYKQSVDGGYEVYFPGYMGALLGRVLCLVRISRT